MWYPTPTRGSACFDDGKTVVNVPAHAQVEEPVAGLDLIFDVQCQFLNVSTAGVVVETAATGQIIRPEDREVAGIGKRDYSVAGGGIGVPRQRAAVDVNARRIIGGVHHAQAVVLAQESLPVHHTGLERVDPLGVVEVGVACGVCEGTILRDGRGLHVRRALDRRADYRWGSSYRDPCGPRRQGSERSSY